MAGRLRDFGWNRWIEPWYLSYAFLGATAAGLAPILLPLAMGKTGTPADVGLVMGAFSLGGLTAPVWGGLADRRGMHRLFLIGGLVVTAATFEVFPLTSSVAARISLAFGQGTGAASASTVANLFIVEMHPRPEWDERIGWLQTFYGGGQVFGLLLAGVLARLDPHLGFLLSAEITLFACLPAWYMAGEARSARITRPLLKVPSRHSELSAGSPQASYHHVSAGLVRRLVRSVEPRLAGFLLAWTVSFAGVAAFFSQYPLVMRHVYGVGASLSSLGFAVAAAAGLFLYVPAGTLSKRYGATRVFDAALAVRMIAFLALVGIGMLHLHIRNLLALTGFAFVVAAWSLLSVTGTEIAAGLAGDHEGEGLGLFNAGTAIAGVAGALVGGWCAGRWGYKSLPVLGVLGVFAGLVLTGAMTFWVKRKSAKEMQ